MYSSKDKLRLFNDTNVSSSAKYRTPFRVDYSRLVHSPGFRRLQGKTQLYPAWENDFFRNRLTHSIEVAQIAKSIALKINQKFSRRTRYIIKIDTDLIEFAALAHDIGHPPFGHQGEEVLDNLMVDYGGFEGNAQTLRLLTKIEKKVFDTYGNPDNDNRYGLNLTSRSIAAILKYDNIIPFSRAQRIEYANKSRKKLTDPVKGYYQMEDSLVQKVKKNVLNGYQVPEGKFKTLECSIMDIADDIAYSTYDLEDTLKAKFSNPFDIAFANYDLLERITDLINSKFNYKVTVEKVANILFSLFENQFPDTSIWSPKVGKLKDLFRFGSAFAYQNVIKLASDGYLRAQFTSNLVNTFIEGIEIVENRHCLALSEVKLNSDVRLTVEVLKRFNFEVNVMSPRLRIAAYRGKEIIEKIFNVLTAENGYLLMPDDYRKLYEGSVSESDKRRIVCDFIAGMTDKYCIEFYARLTSEDPETIFKPF